MSSPAQQNGGASRRPNIVIVQADQLAPDALGAYGNDVVDSPHIDALAEEGAVFDRAYCSTPLCAPSRASMMTGRLPSEIGCYDNGDDFPSSTPTFAHHLRAAGYHTALVGRMHFIGPDQHHGFEERLTTDVYPADMDMVPDWDLDARTKLQWYHDADSVFTAGVSKATVQLDFDEEVGFHTLRHLNDRVRANRSAEGRGEQPQPFLMVTSFIHPHDPYEPPREQWDRYDGVDVDSPAHPQTPDAATDPHTHRLRAMSGFDVRQPDHEQTLRARRAYYAAVSYIDDHVARIRARLRELDLEDDTVVIVTSDHGDMRGEKGLWYKMSPYEQSVRVPLIVSGPEHLVPRGRFRAPVSLLDLLPTVLGLAGAEDPEAPGTSLLTLAEQERAGTLGPQDRDVVVEYLAEGVHHPQLTLVRGSHKFVLCPGDPDQLFDLDADPHELTNLAADPEHSALAAQLRKELETRYDLDSLEADVRSSQHRRRLVSRALATGRTRPWDLVPEPASRYVRGDFWSALEHGTIPDPER
ncbi:choline-sulfatase [Nesterenkonia marinintestina]|uniref:choline-sulfatase n=1 Tax=Nesterenkonia marinintestina TaxID=2979865 RepID=UPI0021C1CFD7|nr:choline-sulfatase [Nesterenkonia sp. GX14115]